MYSYEGPVIVLPSAFFATGNSVPGPAAPPIRMLKLAPLSAADASHPLQTSVEPRGIRKALASTSGPTMGPGSLPAATRPNVFHVLRPRLGGSYIILCAPLDRSIGLRM